MAMSQSPSLSMGRTGPSHRPAASAGKADSAREGPARPAQPHNPGREGGPQSQSSQSWHAQRSHGPRETERRKKKSQEGWKSQPHQRRPNSSPTHGNGPQLYERMFASGNFLCVRVRFSR
jgi:hypothetical protein